MPAQKKLRAQEKGNLPRRRATTRDCPYSVQDMMNDDEHQEKRCTASTVLKVTSRPAIRIPKAMSGQA